VAAGHGNAKLLLSDLAHLALLHLESIVVLVDLKILHLTLQLLILCRKLLLLRDHAHVDILLVGCGDLLLLCLQHLDLLSERELLHWRGVSVWERMAIGESMLEQVVDEEIRYILIKGVISDGLRRWAMCRRRPAGP
jgi:hypothetical protein